MSVMWVWVSMGILGVILIPWFLINVLFDGYNDRGEEYE